MGCLLETEVLAVIEPVPVATALLVEDKIMIENEKKLEISSYSSKDLILAIKAESSSGNISFPQLKRAFCELNMSGDGVGVASGPFAMLLKKFKYNMKLIKTRELCLFCILIGKGSAVEKAEWLFKLYDENALGILNKNEVSQMISEIFDVICVKLPVVSIGTTDDTITQAQADQYFRPLIFKKDSLIQNMCDFILNGYDICQEEFVSKLSDTLNSQILWCGGTRLFLRKMLSEL